MSKDKYNQAKDALLGEPHGTASNRLRKMLLFKYVQLAGHDVCYRCGKKIERVEDLSVEHTIPWQKAENPKGVFFDLDKIAFSHLRCNCEAGDRSKFIPPNRFKTVCVNGHPFDAKRKHHGYDERYCRQCNRDRMKEERIINPSYARG